MRVIVVNDFAHVNGGAASVAIMSAIGLANRGHAVNFLSAVEPIDSRLTESNVDVICTRQEEIAKDPRRVRAFYQGLWNPSAGRALNRMLAKANREDTIVHIHGWSKALSSAVVRTAIESGFKIVCTMHDYFIACPNGGFFDYKSFTHCQMKPLSYRCIVRNCDSRSYSHKLWRIGRHVVQREMGHLPQGISAFIEISRFSGELLRRYIPEGAHVFHIPNPVDARQERPVSAECNDKFLMVGRLAPEKGGSLFARAARNGRLNAVFVGDGPCRTEIELANPAAEITGWLSRDRVSAYFSRARSLVFPSLWYEVQPLAILEAAARGVPAIVSDRCAGAESVIDGVTGLLFSNGSEQSLSNALHQLAGDDGLTRRLGRNAYERYWADAPTIERHISLLEQAYKALLYGPPLHASGVLDMQRTAIG